MPKINAFKPLVHEKIFKDLSKFPFFGPLRDQLLEQIWIPIS